MNKMIEQLKAKVAEAYRAMRIAVGDKAKKRRAWVLATADLMRAEMGGK
jgi:hypothetical protein